MDDKVEFVPVSFCKLMKHQLTVKLLNGIFRLRRHYIALHAFPQNFDLMSQRWAKNRKTGKNFAFVKTVEVLSLSLRIRQL